MTSSFIGEHKSDIALTVAGGGLGAYAGMKTYCHTPTKMVKNVIEEGEKKAYVTDRFIKYATGVAKKDLFSQIDRHTNRSYLINQKKILKQAATKAKANPKGNERWSFQKMYDLGIQFMTNRADVPKKDIDVAKRGANAIQYGRETEKRLCAIKGGILGGAIVLAGKLLYDYYKKQHPDTKQDDITITTVKPQKSFFENMKSKIVK